MTIPGPRSPLAQLRVTRALLADPGEGYRALQRTYGDVVVFGYGRFRYTALFGPDANRFILSERPECFAWRDALAYRWQGVEPDPYAFVPFGGGSRRCLGFAFATQELKILLAQLVRRTTLEPLRRVARPTGLAAVRPKGGVPVRITRAPRLPGLEP